MHRKTVSCEPQPIKSIPARSVESGWSFCGEDLGAGCLGDAVRKREFEVLGKELLDVWALDIFGLLDLNNLENLNHVLVMFRNFC